MNTPLLLAAISPKLTSWLTPVWVIGLGALCGILLLVTLWGLFWLLSRIPLLGTMPSNPKQTAKWATIMALVLAAGWLILLGGGTGGWFSLLLVALLVLLASWCLSYAFLVLCWRRTVDEVIPGVTEGPLWPLA